MTTDLTATLDLVEMAVTWAELDYSHEDVIPPRRWLEFAAEHEWEDPDVAERLFSAAAEIALRRAG
ncbi:MAG: hypothetical protein AB1673_06905 [Actinomycetota bacterium]